LSLHDHASEPSSLELILAGYAAGSLPPALHALIGSHLELSPVNRPFVRSLEDALGKTVIEGTPCAIRAREARLDAIFACGADTAGRQTGVAGEPKALLHFLGKPVDELEFRTILPGLRECRLAVDGGVNAVLYKIRAGRKMPQHSHEGSEVTLVLRGGFRDDSGHFRRGDIAVADEHLDHVPIADDDEECLCFAVLDAPLRLTGMFGRWANLPMRLLEKLERKSGKPKH
jgi:putative transcriptional regulator